MPPESSREPNPCLSWEGDKMFNIYIYDYCLKRGFKKTARELMAEADLGSEAVPPINARQGLLFEWWSVFWVLFQAKSGNSNSDDALLYIHHQNAQKAAQRMPSQQPGGIGSQPTQGTSNSQAQPQAAMRGISNGIPPQRQSSTYHSNGTMPNGINPAMGGQPSQPGQVPQQPIQGQSALHFGNIGGQPNGVAVSQQPPQGGQQHPGTPAISFNPAMTSGPNQRPPMNGQLHQPAQQSRGPFTSPPMAHSPQATGGQPSGQAGHAPMAQLGHSPQMTPMSRSMLPPSGTPGAPMVGSLNLSGPQQGGPPPTTFTSVQGPPLQGQGPNPVAVRPPSRSRPSPSPSMSARQPPGTGGPQHQGGMGMIPIGSMQGMGMGGMNLGGMPTGVGGFSHDAINHDFMMIPHANLSNLKHEFGFGDKDLNMNDKVHLVNVWKQRGAVGAQQQRKDGLGILGSAPGMLPTGQPQNPHQGLSFQQRPQQPQPSGPNNRLKRNSTSPPDEQAEQRNDISPPDRKRMKRSPAEPSLVPPGYSQHIQSGSGQPPTPTPQQTSVPPGQHQAQMIHQAQMMMRQPQIVMPAGGQVKGGPPMGAGPQPVGAPMHSGQMQPPQQAGLFRGPPGPPTGRPTQFHPTPLTQYASKPHSGITANSPGNGSKDTSKDVKPPVPPPPGPISPRNTGTNTAPPTPGASNQQTPGLPATSLPPPPPAQSTGGPTGQTQQQQSAVMGMPMNIPGMSGMNTGEFMFEPLMEEFDGDINFERDFGQWFNNQEEVPGLDLK